MAEAVPFSASESTSGWNSASLCSSSPDEPITVAERSRSGRRAASRRATKPPIELPTKWQGAMPRCSISAAASSARVSMSSWSAGAAALAPWPRWS